jgi:histidinol-phosphatase (PHP family)
MLYYCETAPHAAAGFLLQGGTDMQSDQHPTAGAVCDMHVHTVFSCDSKASLSSYCEQAIRQNIGCVCFTDHVDFNPNDYGFGYYKPYAFFSDFLRARDQYGGKVRLLCGVEFSEPHLYPAEFERCRKEPYDFIIGSVHYWHEDLFPSEMVKHGVPLETCYEKYWGQVLAAVRFGGFGLDEAMPGSDILRLYKAAGGEYVTIGSDAHAPDDLAAGHGHARRLIDELHLTEVVYAGRRRMPVMM